MSLDALKEWNSKLEKPPQDVPQPSSFGELAQQGRGADAIVSQREIEIDFNKTEQDSAYRGGFIDSKLLPSALGPTVDPFAVEVGYNIPEPMQKAMFALDYTSRLIRSAMAMSGVTAKSERFRDVRKSQGFWIAMADFVASTAVLKNFRPSITEKELGRTVELTKEVPALLTDPAVPTTTVPGFGAIAGDVAEVPEERQWMFDLAGELFVESNITGAVKKLARKGSSDIVKSAYEGSEQFLKRKGINRFLGNITDEDISAIAQARRAKKVGLLGTRPPQGQIDNAVNKTFDYIQETGEARLTKQQAINAQRKKGAARMYDVQGQGYGRGYSKRLRKAGATEKTKSVFRPFLDASPHAVDDYVTLQKTIDNWDFGGSKIYTTANAQEALAKLYEFGELVTKGDVEHLRDIFGNDFANSLGKFVDKPKGVLGKTVVGAEKFIRGMNSTARTLMTTGELSFLLRQGNYRAWSRPQEAMRSFVVASRSLVSPKYAKYWDEAMRASASGRRAIDSGLFLGKFGDVTLSAREEFFMSEWLHKVPGIGNLVNRFESGYVAGLNQLRLDWFDEGMDIISRSGKAGDEKLVAQWSDYINNMTGRAELDKLTKLGLGSKADKIMGNMVETSKDVLFAPRFSASKWNRHKVTAELLFGENTPRGIRQMLVNDTVVKWRRYERLARFATQGGYEVESDPRSADFLKIKRGDTRFDVLGGDAQIAVLLARLATQQTKDSSTGEIKDKLGSELAQQYLSGKLNPAWSFMFDKMIAQQTFEGEDLNDPKVLAKEIANKFIPLYIGDINDKIFNGFEEEGLTIAEAMEGTVSTVTMGFLGAGVQTYPPSARKEYELLLNDKAQELYFKDWPDLTPFKKQEVVWEAELDNIDKIEELQSEMGMKQLSPGGAARIQKARNKSSRMIRKGLGKDFKLFKESFVDTGSIGIDIGDVRLNPQQHKELHDLYISNIKSELKFYPDISEMDSKDPIRRQYLEDILEFSRDDAVNEILFR
jgi:hypothetical protein